MFSLFAGAAAQLRRDRQPVAVLVDVAADVETDWDFAARNLRRLALAAHARRRRLQRLVHVPDPAPGAPRDRPVAAAVHQVGRLRVRAARQGGRLPHGDDARCRGLAHPVDRQERRARLAGLLPPAQPVRRRAAALAVPARRADDPGEPQPPAQAPRSRCSTPPSSCATRPSRTCWPVPTSCTTDLPVKLGEVREFVKQFTRCPAQGRPRRLPAGRAGEAARARTWTPRSPAAPRSCSPRSRARIRQLASTRELSREFPEAGSRPWTPSGSASPATTRPW